MAGFIRTILSFFQSSCQKTAVKPLAEISDLENRDQAKNHSSNDQTNKTDALETENQNGGTLGFIRTILSFLQSTCQKTAVKPLAEISDLENRDQAKNHSSNDQTNKTDALETENQNGVTLVSTRLPTVDIEEESKPASGHLPLKVLEQSHVPKVSTCLSIIDIEEESKPASGHLPLKVLEQSHVPKVSTRLPIVDIEEESKPASGHLPLKVLEQSHVPKDYYFRIIIIGHNLEAKCKFADALTKQKNLFKQLNCRRHLRVKKFGKLTTLAGYVTVVVLTPNLNTPAWTHLKESIKNYNHKAFVYINDDSQIQVNHSNTMYKIRTDFKNTEIFEINYSDAPSHKYRIRPNVSFTEQIEDAKKVLNVISSTVIAKDNPQYKGGNYIEGSTESRATTNKPIRQSTELEFDWQNEELRKSLLEITLPEKLTDSDWENYSKTLKCGRAKSNLVRVNIVGNQNAGKTTLLKLLQNLKVQCPDEMQCATEALDITDVATRCWERDGKKQWETSEIGYETDLNVQRMAEAMQNANKDVKENNDEVMDEVSVVEEYMISSAFIEDDFDVSTSQPYENIDKHDKLGLYLKKIIGRVNSNAPECVYVSYWDFAGQSTYYTTHQAFMSHSAVYILVVDLSLDIKRRSADSLKFRSKHVHESSVAECINFWMSSIKAYTTDSKGGTSPILVVGTHKDELKPTEDSTLDKLIDEKFLEIQEILGMTDVECIAIDNTKPDPDALQAIRDRVLELGLGVVDEMIPAQWIELERKVQEQKNNGRHIIKFEYLKDLDKENDMPMRDDDRLKAFLAHQHCRGHLIHFPHKDLKDIIILDPEVLSSFLNSLMRKSKQVEKGAKGAYNHDGIINQIYIDESLKKLEKSEYQELSPYLTDILIHLSIIHPYQLHLNEQRYILPCLLPYKNEENKSENAEMRVFRVEFRNNTMPSTFFYILLSGLMKKWKLLERNPGKPEVFNLYACFYLDKETVQIKVFWRDSSIIVRILNFSQTVKFVDVGLARIVDTLTECITNIFRIYRHIETQHDIKAECPKHGGHFVSVQKLRQDGEAMCYIKDSNHAVTLNEVMGITNCEKERYPILTRRLTTLHLSRLALELKKEDATNLATRIRLHTGNIEADSVAMMSKDLRYRRFLILQKWHYNRHEASLGDLLESLTDNRDYNKVDLIHCLEAVPKKNNYDILDEKLDKIPGHNQDIISAMECVGALYPFLAFELGISYSEVEEICHNQSDLKRRTHDILLTWRRGNPDTSVPRKLLDTAKFLDINTDPIENALKNI